MSPLCSRRRRAPSPRPIGRGSRLAIGVAVAAAGLLTAGCGEVATEPTARAEVEVARLEVVSGDTQLVWSGRRSEALVVRALGPDGKPAPDAEVRFRVEGGGGGLLSQDIAVTDGAGLAESFLLDTRSGEGRVVATAGAGSATFTFRVDRAPGRIAFTPGAGTAGLPGLPHPDSVVAVQVFDTEERPLPGFEVWFAGPGVMAPWADTTDVDGRASSVLRPTRLEAGPAAVVAFILGFPEVTAQADRPMEAAADRVVLVSVDGLRGDALERWAPPTLLRLAAEGASTVTATTVSPALTVPAHLSIFSGASPATHGVYTDQLEFTPEMVALDPVFRHARSQGRTAVAFMSSQGPLEGFRDALSCRLAFGLDSLTLVEPRASLLAGAAEPSLADPELDLVFVHLPDPDLAGHAHGWSSPEYGEAVLRADSAVSRIVEHARGEDVLVVVVSDHGGGGAWGSNQHGSDAPADREVPLILWGGRVVPGTELPPGTSVMDVAPTALWALGMAPPPGYEGRPLLPAFR